MRLRLILSFVLIVLVSVISVVLVARQSAANQVRAFMFRGGMTDSTELVNSLESYFQVHGSWEGVETLLLPPGRGAGSGGSQWGGGMMHGMMNQRLRLADARGNLVVDTDSGSASGKLSSAEKDAALPIRVEGETVGYLLAEGGMGYSSGEERSILNRLNTAALTAGLIAGGVSLLLAIFLAYRLLRPVRDLTQAAQRLGEGDFTQRVLVNGNDELAVLGRTFNWMADSLEKAGESRRAMTADIAHELRTPLAIQRAHLEAMQDGIYSMTEDNLQPVVEQNLLLTRLVDDLRTLALADSGQLNLERSQTDFAALVKRIVERFKPQADSRQVEMILVFGSGAQHLPLIMLDPLRMEQILSNLISNALRYTPDMGRIEIHIQAKAHQVELAIHDSGPGIPQEALPHVFERFYRADRARSRSEGGSGLGLAIARQLVEAHGGTLKAANHPQGGAVFIMTLPVS